MFLVLVFLTIGIQQSIAQEENSLFNGKDLSGWYAFEAKTGKHENASELFVAKDGMIRMYGATPGYLMYATNYKNFTLKAEFKWNTDESFARKSNSKNSGIMYLVPETAKDTLWPQGIQFQVKEGATGDFVLLQQVGITVKGEKVAPGASVVSKRFANAEKPIGEWNTVEVICNNGKITQILNGVVVNEGTEPSVSEGRVLLQYEGYPIDFKDIFIKTL